MGGGGAGGNAGGAFVWVVVVQTFQIQSRSHA